MLLRSQLLIFLYFLCPLQPRHEPSKRWCLSFSRITVLELRAFYRKFFSQVSNACVSPSFWFQKCLSFLTLFINLGTLRHPTLSWIHHLVVGCPSRKPLQPRWLQSVYRDPCSFCWLSVVLQDLCVCLTMIYGSTYLLSVSYESFVLPSFCSGFLSSSWHTIVKIVVPTQTNPESLPQCPWAVCRQLLTHCMFLVWF